MALQEAGQEIELRYTREQGHATQLAREAVTAGVSRLVVCGGDGTVSEVLPALAGSPTALGLLPFGTANDLARALAIPRKIATAVQILLDGRIDRIDLGVAGDRLFATVAAFGFDAGIDPEKLRGQREFKNYKSALEGRGASRRWRRTSRRRASAPPPTGAMSR